MGDTEISNDVDCDHGIACQSILLGARDKGPAGCMIGSIKREALREHLNISKQFKILLVLAVGKPQEEVVIETVEADANIRYWRDEQGVHHVPKRKLDDIIVASYAT